MDRDLENPDHGVQLSLDDLEALLDCSFSSVDEAVSAAEPDAGEF